MNKIVLIISEERDLTTHHVMDWLFKWDVPVVRINDTSLIHLEYLDMQDENVRFLLRIQDGRGRPDIFLNSEDIGSVWYRRGELNFATHTQEIANTYPVLQRWMFRERQKLADFFYHIFTVRYRCINSFMDNGINKLQVLQLAASLGLKIPETFISASADNILRKVKAAPAISKAIDSSFISEKFYRHYGYTTEVSEDAFDQSENAFLCVIQKNIVKKYELRIFYLDKKCYSSAILSQNDDTTKTDFRNYNKERPNRILPYQLPASVETKIILLMESLRMISGSIDMIVTQRDEFIFLEVNPIGQFAQVSYPCSYNLEEKVALYLCQSNH